MGFEGDNSMRANGAQMTHHVDYVKTRGVLDSAIIQGDGKSRYGVRVRHSPSPRPGPMTIPAAVAYPLARRNERTAILASGSKTHHVSDVTAWIVKFVNGKVSTCLPKLKFQ